MMADPKYADLPGIAYDQPDVYESSELPEAEQLNTYSEDESDSIERVRLSASEAFNKFKGKHINTGGVDFSDRISRKPRTGYNSVFWELPGEGEKESLVQKRERLKFELAGLLDDVTKAKEDAKEDAEAKSMVEMIREIETMGNQLKRLKFHETLENDFSATLADPGGAAVIEQLKAKIDVFKKTGSSLPPEDEKTKSTSGKKGPEEGQAALKYEMIYVPEKARLQEVQRIASVEQRLARLENAIGTSDSEKYGKFGQTFKSQGLMETVEQLGAKAALFDSSQVEAMESRIATLAHRMDALAQKKASMQQQQHDTEREEKIARMYEMITKLEATSDLVPQTINRMLALSSIHQQAGDFAKSLAQLELLQTDITNGLESKEALLKEVRTNFAANLESIGANVASLSERISKLPK